MKTLVSLIATALIALALLLFGGNVVTAFAADAGGIKTTKLAQRIGSAVRTQALLSDGMRFPQHLTCASEKCTGFVELPGLVVSPNGGVTLSGWDVDDFTVTVTSRRGDVASTWSAATGTVTVDEQGSTTPVVSDNAFGRWIDDQHRGATELKLLVRSLFA